MTDEAIHVDSRALDMPVDAPVDPACATKVDDEPVYLPVGREAKLLWWLRMRTALTTLGQAMVQARLRVMIIVTLSAFVWYGLFFLFFEAFRFIGQTIIDQHTYDMTIRTVLSTFFLTMMAMLVFSSAIISFVSLFRTAETRFLLVQPIRPGRIFLYRLGEAVTLSSWGFVILSSPLLIALGLQTGAAWPYYVLILPFTFGFVYIPTCIGTIAVMLIIRFFPSFRLRTLIWLTVYLIAGVILWVGYSYGTGATLTPSWFRGMIDRLAFVNSRLFPSWWFSTGILEGSRGVLGESLLYLGLLTANALSLRMVAVRTAETLYLPAYNRLLGRAGGESRKGDIWLIERFLSVIVKPLARPIRLVLLKDFRVFRRDPAQWSQFLIFGTLLLLYFLNIRRFRYESYQIRWVSMVSFLNLSVVGLLLSTFTTRFVYPSISLEGRRMWVLGLLPVRRDTILWGKFWFAAGGAIVPCCLLVLLSDIMLRVPLVIVLMHQGTCVGLCLGLSGLAVGIGARLPNFREPSPAKIATGFGGTLSLVLSSMFILSMVFLTAVPAYHFVSTGGLQVDRHGMLVEDTTSAATTTAWLIGGIGGSLLLTVLTTLVPMKIGTRAFRKLEV